MSEAGHLISAGTTIKTNPISQRRSVAAVSRRKDLTLISKRSSRTPRRLITISTGDGRWHGKWNSEYLISLQDLNLQDLIEDNQQKDAPVSINLCIQKHASFGFSVDGRIITSFTRNCSNCSSPYCREIDSNFNVWILPSNRDNGAVQLPEIGGDDPSVIYVKPGYEANLDSLIQDTVRLMISVKDTCSESCEKSEPTLQFIDRENAASIDKRWSRLLELKKSTFKCICSSNGRSQLTREESLLFKVQTLLHKFRPDLPSVTFNQPSHVKTIPSPAKSSKLFLVKMKSLSTFGD